jgi:hypothetical protein
LSGAVPGDEGYEAEGEEEGEGAKKEGAPSKEEEQRAKEDKFGEWWRARLVSEFEGDLGGLAAVRLRRATPSAFASQALIPPFH